MSDLRDFVFLSRYAGQRFDIIQAGGGNTSVKLDESAMVVKASGFHLSDVEADKGHARVRYRDLIALLDRKDIQNTADRNRRDGMVEEAVRAATPDPSVKPSIEVLLHAQLSKFVLHSHPIVVNAALCREDWSHLLGELFPDSLRMEYVTPGYDLAVDLRNRLQDPRPSAIFLQNHGLIVTADSARDVIDRTEDILRKLEQRLKVDLSDYRFTTELSAYINRFFKTDRIAYLSRDTVITEAARKNALDNLKPFAPDGAVFCGAKPFRVQKTTDETDIRLYSEQYGEPAIVLHGSSVYILAQSVRKARDIEDILRFQVLTLEAAGRPVHFLSDAEIRHLCGMPAEKHRQNI